MRIVFDTLGSTERSGGMRLHSSELIRTWIDLFPDDKLTILGGAWTAQEFGSLVEVIPWPNEHVLGRSVGQLFASAIVGHVRRADRIVSFSPIVTPFAGKVSTVCFQHDWRHKKNPNEFGVLQRVYRKLWVISANRAALTVCISEKARAETLLYARRSRTTVIENGRDHARRWPPTTIATAVPYIVTFGHHNNKRPELVIDALPHIRESIGIDLTLVVLGARGAYARTLTELAESTGVGDHVVIPGFVEDSQYRSTIAGASVLVLASSDEGFGLPVAEAEYFGIPAVITSDSGMSAIFGDYPVEASPDPISIARAVTTSYRGGPHPQGQRGHTWTAAVTALRAALSSL